MQRKPIAIGMCLFGAAAASCLMLVTGVEFAEIGRGRDDIFRPFLAAIPLLFAFAYPRSLFADALSQGSRMLAAILHGLAGVTATVLFAYVASPFWRNPVRNGDSIGLALFPLFALCVFLFAGLFLLFKNRSSLTIIACILFWPYWFEFGLAAIGRWFQETPLYTAFYFVCFLCPVLFAFATGAASIRPKLASAVAFVGGLLAMPWLHYKLRDIGMGNVWLTFNSPDRDRLVSPPWLAALTIFSVALIWLAAATGALRLVPSHWHLRKSPICDRTWPAFLVSFVLVAIWFCQSVMPYRIPGAVDVDSSSWPVLQILHVEKRGLQFHENCARVHGGYKGYPLAVSFTSNDRRLFQYSFQKGYGSGGELREPVREHIRAIIQRSESPKPSSDKVKPLRAWNADGWYITGKGIGLGAYTTENGQAPSKEVVELFRELQSIPHTREGQSLQRDVCLGFCYDPLSGFGYLYANQRCFNDGNRVVCQ